MLLTSRVLLSASFCTLLGACGTSAPAGMAESGSGSGGGAASAGSAGALSAAGNGSSLPAQAGGGGSRAMAGSDGSGVAGASTESGGTGGADLGAVSGGPGSGGSSHAAGGSGAAGGEGGSAGSGVNHANLPAVTLHLAGDSTVMTYAADSAQEGWGQELGQYFTSKVTIDNRALGGASIQTFQSRWTGLVGSIKAGDFVMADFGINDSGSVAGRSVSTADFKMFMSQMNAQVIAKQATFIIVTPSALQYWDGNTETNARLAPYVAVENSLGTTDKIPIDDLNARSLEFLNMIGPQAAMQIYINGDKAHFTKAGATQMAKFVAMELQRIGSPLSAYLK